MALDADGPLRQSLPWSKPGESAGNTCHLGAVSSGRRVGADCAKRPAVQAVVLAGGFATRMHPRTLTVAKSMLEVAGRPFVDWQLERLAAAGVTDVVMCVAHLGDSIRKHVQDGASLGVRVAWSEEGPRLLGT